MKPHIAIIGAGFSGTVIAFQLIQKTTRPIKISIIEKSAKMAKGVAYGTNNPHHLLNVRAENMGALSEDPLHFYNWLKSKNMEFGLKDFVPRMIYAAYLASIFDKTDELAKEKNCEIVEYHDEVIDMEVLNDKRFNLKLLSGLTLNSDYVILAAGVPENREFKLVVKSGDSCNYIKDLWSEKLPEFKPHAKIAFIGTGLTMIDAMISVKAIDPRVIAISKHGLLPEVHVDNLLPYPPFINDNNLPTTALELIKKVHAEIKRAKSEGLDWRVVIDSLRPITNMIWNHLNQQEKKKILKKLSSIWSTHRHRRPKLYHELLEHLQIIADSIDSIEINENQPIKINLKNNPPVFADYLINCAGPESNILKNKSLLFKNLIKNHLITQDTLNMGLMVDSSYRVLGRGEGRFFAVGLVLFGTLYETVAVPELREQCSAIAEAINMELEALA